MTLSTSAEDSRLWRATLVSNDRITAPESREDVRRLRFAIDDSFNGRVGQCLRLACAWSGGLGSDRWREYRTPLRPKVRGLYFRHPVASSRRSIILESNRRAAEVEPAQEFRERSTQLRFGTE